MCTGYGDDPWTEKACARLRELFETDCEVFFVFNGTAANALALAQICRPYHAVIAHAFSHIEEDEAGAPALFSGGAKIVTADTPLAKLTPDAVDALAREGPRRASRQAARAVASRRRRSSAPSTPSRRSPLSQRWRGATA